jgi:hypothetical protein
MAEEQKIKCYRCHKERPITEMMQTTIIGRGRRYDHYKRREVACVTEELLWFCKGMSCASDEQMSREG